ncbi:DeoR/GlpR family DNA-binding transcription regulator [Amycolatopsis lurida]
MFAAERRQVILELVRSNGAVSLRELARIVQASEVTVRRDLRQLAADGLLARKHGGAVATNRTSYEPSCTEKAKVAGAQKEAIAALAACLVSPGDSVALGPGTTTQALARRLVRTSELTVVTNSLLVAQIVAQAPGVEVLMPGGTLRASIFATVGSAAEAGLAQLRVRHAFLSGNGLTAARGLSTPNPAVAGADRALAGAAEQVVVLADSTKIGADAMVQTIPPERIDRLVTDEAADPAELDGLRAAGTEIGLAAVGPNG